MTLRKLLAKGERLREKIVDLQAVLDWWDKEMTKKTNRMTRLEAKPYSPERDAEIEKLTGEIEYLVGRTNTERKAVTDLEQQVIEFLKERSAFIKAHNVKKKT